MVRRATTLLAVAAAGLAFAACGSDDENAANTHTLPAITVETTETATTSTTAPTATTPPAATTPGTQTTPEDTGGATVPAPGDRPVDPGETGGASPSSGGTGGGSPPVETIPSPTQDPECRPGTGPGFPDRPQCEPVSGPDARDDDG